MGFTCNRITEIDLGQSEPQPPVMAFTPIGETPVILGNTTSVFPSNYSGNHPGNYTSPSGEVFGQALDGQTVSTLITPFEGEGEEHSDQLNGSVSAPVQAISSSSSSTNFSFTTNNGINFIYGIASGGYGNGSGSISVVFPNPTDVVGFGVEGSHVSFMNLLGSTSNEDFFLKISFYDEQATLIHQEQVTRVEDGFYEFSLDGIKAMTLENNDSNGLYYSNFTFNT